MDQSTSRWPAAAAAEPAETILEDRYGQLQAWGRVLARGDQALAEEIVHDLCLQLMLSPPDFGRIANLEGYLYTCLRHLYVSKLARASREAVRFVNVADCDSLWFARDAGQRMDSLEIQNVLRRICCYSIWRREQAKSFSYFILHFFHGYFHREIAELACLPVAAIYNKLKAARTELRVHLEEPDKLRLAQRREAPRAAWLRTAVSSEVLFRELRGAIFEARRGACLPEEELLSYYRAAAPVPLPCSLLAHIVSCERCLKLIDRHLRRPTLRDRDALDGFDPSPARGMTGGDGAVPAGLRSMSWRLRRLREHRPGMLSIAVNGRIVASHDVRGEYSLLSARINRPDSAEFVEVFSGQDLRLALLPIESRPPEGPHMLNQRVALSDDRCLELRLVFDGLGLNSELSYFDPTFLPNVAGEEAEEFETQASAGASPAVQTEDGLPSEPRRSWAALERLLGKLRPSLVWGWACALLVLSGVGLLLWRSVYRPLDAETILKRSMVAESRMLEGHAEHQEMSVEEVGDGGRVLAEGSVDLWRDGVTGRYMRRLYDRHHRLVAAAWKGRDGAAGSYAARRSSGDDRLLEAGGLWMEDLSPKAFRAVAREQVRVTADEQGYRLAADVDDRNEPQWVYVTLMLNRRWLPVGEVLRVRAGSAVREVRLMQTGFEVEPASSVPDAVFDPGGLRPEQEPVARSSRASALDGERASSEETRLVALDIGVLYQLHRLAMDTGEPIRVERTPEERIRVTGMVSGGARKAELLAALRSLPDQQALDVQLDSQATMGAPAKESARGGDRSATVYDVAVQPPLAEPVLRAYFTEHPLPNVAVDVAVTQFEDEALDHAQGALQHAYALDRLGGDFTPEELYQVDASSRREWAEMVEVHAVALETELRSIKGEMILIGETRKPVSDGSDGEIASPADFARASRVLLQETQRLNRRIDAAFASGATVTPKQSAATALTGVADAIPLPQAVSMAKLAERLKAAGEGGDGGGTRAEDGSPGAPLR